MTKEEIEWFFAALETAMREFPFRPIPIDVAGRRQMVQSTAWQIPPDVVELLQAAGVMERLQSVAAKFHNKLDREGDGSLKVVWDPN